MGRQPLVLVVDDDEPTQEMLRTVLEDAGYRVRCAGDGAAALTQAQDLRPDIIILDLRMPVLDGRGFLERYRQLPGPHAGIVVVSTVLRPKDVAASGLVAAVAPKPFDLDHLLACVASCVRGGRGAE